MKNVWLVLLSLCMCLALAGCGTEYEDTNGAENFALQTITDQNIIDLDVGASGFSESETNLGGVTCTEYSSKNFNGVTQIYLTNFLLPSDIEIYVGHMNVKQGNFKLVVIHDDEIIHEFAPDTLNETFRFEDLTGSFAIHAAGESASFTFSLSIL